MYQSLADSSQGQNAKCKERQSSDKIKFVKQRQFTAEFFAPTTKLENSMTPLCPNYPSKKYSTKVGDFVVLMGYFPCTKQSKSAYYFVYSQQK